MLVVLRCFLSYVAELWDLGGVLQSHRASLHRQREEQQSGAC